MANFRHVISSAAFVWVLGAIAIAIGGLKLVAWLLVTFFALWRAVLGS